MFNNLTKKNFIFNFLKVYKKKKLNYIYLSFQGEKVTEKEANKVEFTKSFIAKQNNIMAKKIENGIITYIYRKKKKT